MSDIVVFMSHIVRYIYIYIYIYHIYIYISQYNNMSLTVQLNVDTLEFDRTDLLIYEEVTPMPPFQRNVLVLIGAQGVGRRTLKQRLIKADKEHFGSVVPRKYGCVATHKFACVATHKFCSVVPHIV